MNTHAMMRECLVSIRLPAEVDRLLEKAQTFLRRNLITSDQFLELVNDTQELRARLKLASDRSHHPVKRLCNRLRTALNRKEAASGKRDPKLTEKKRNFASSPMLPLDDEMRGKFTEGERSVLFIVISDVDKFGQCTDCVAKIAHRAGVGVTTARNAIRKAKDVEIGLLDVMHRPRPGQKHDTNIITVRAWTAADRAKQPRPRRIKPIGFKIAKAIEHKYIDIRKVTDKTAAIGLRLKDLLSLPVIPPLLNERI